MTPWYNALVSEVADLLFEKGNTMTMRKTKVAEAYERAKMIRDVLSRIGRCMEVTEDKCGILWERWLIGQTQIVIFSTPSWTEVFKPVTDDMTWEGTIRALEALAAEKA